ncbi:hypothetical protein AK830_g10012 [Neonectria ditissima]|uniref:DUF7702 domain-containing protein n=1 Tax=Neonectria ditissima TaxID=78410 RepID=A0A0P7AGQ6_9HYPO|nr:hypothetical protein AK830_g10012 [Neonectria ditissima]
MSPVSTAKLAIYAILCLPAVYILIKHGGPGFLGWLYVTVFFTLRIVGGALSLSGSPSAGLISSIGLSPLLLAAAGILHEARVYRFPQLDRKWEWIRVALYHLVVTGGLALVAAGASHLQDSDPAPSDATLAKAGLGILVLAWTILAGWACLSLRSSSVVVDAGVRRRPTDPERAGTMLLYSVLFSVVFIGIRLIYTLVAMTSGSGSLNPGSASLAVQVCLTMLPELLAALAFLAVGVCTRNVRCLSRGVEAGGRDDMKGWRCGRTYE